MKEFKDNQAGFFKTQIFKYLLYIFVRHLKNELKLFQKDALKD